MALIITYNKTFEIITKLIGTETEGEYTALPSTSSNKGNTSAPKASTAPKSTSKPQGSQQKRATAEYGPPPQEGGKIPLVEFWTSFPLFYSGTQVKNTQTATNRSDKKITVQVKLSDLVWDKSKKAWTDPNGKYGDPAATYKTPVDKLISTFKVHEKEKSTIEKCYIDINKAYGLEKIYELGLNTCSGTYCPRNIRGGNTYSMHSWGTAIDILAGLNGLKTKAPKAQFSKPEYKKFLEIMESNGWYSLGKRYDFDYMHFQTTKP
jgi:hypothetical protein